MAIDDDGRAAIELLDVPLELPQRDVFRSRKVCPLVLVVREHFDELTALCKQGVDLVDTDRFGHRIGHTRRFYRQTR